MWTYRQRTGLLLFDGAKVGVGYSGAGEGRNNPALQAMRNVGPIPRGKWLIGAPFNHTHKGPLCMRLTPIGHKALGRTGFMIHGDSISAPGSASNGCIVLARPMRQRIAVSPDRELVVE